MLASHDAFACEQCSAPMAPISGVPVLQSLQGHAVHRCEECGHILLVQEDREPDVHLDRHQGVDAQALGGGR